MPFVLTGCLSSLFGSVREDVEIVAKEEIAVPLTIEATPVQSMEKITNLPQELYYNNPFDGSKSSGAYFNTLRHDFIINKTTTLEINIRVENGYLDMDIYDKNKEKTVVDLDKISSTSDPNTLEAEIVLKPGTYSVVLSADKFQGMYHVLKVSD